MVFIYILELDNGKYYVGKTTNPDFRLKQHFNSSGSQWTKKYKPKTVLKIIPNCDNYDEDKYTLKFMKKYGINNVRGGSFCEFKLNKDNLNTIKKMINGSTDKCYICGENGHFARDCYQDEDNILEEFENLYCKNKNSKTNFKPENICYRCGREGHNSDDCYAKTTITGEEIGDSIDEEMKVFCCRYCDKEFDTLKGATCHENLYCKNKNSKTKIKPENICYRCGREGHHLDDCYAKTTITGEEIDESSDEEITVFCCRYCDKEFDTLKGATCHENLYCKNKNSKTNSKPENICYRCGREGHHTANCYASKHINGKYLS